MGFLAIQILNGEIQSLGSQLISQRDFNFRPSQRYHSMHRYTCANPKALYITRLPVFLIILQNNICTHVYPETWSEQPLTPFSTPRPLLLSYRSLARLYCKLHGFSLKFPSFSRLNHDRRSGDLFRGWWLSLEENFSSWWGGSHYFSGKFCIGIDHHTCSLRNWRIIVNSKFEMILCVFFVEQHNGVLIRSLIQFLGSQELHLVKIG